MYIQFKTHLVILGQKIFLIGLAPGRQMKVGTGQQWK